MWDSNFGSSAELMPQAAAIAKLAAIRANKEKLCNIEDQAGRRGDGGGEGEAGRKPVSAAIGETEKLTCARARCPDYTRSGVPRHHRNSLPFFSTSPQFAPVWISDRKATEVKSIMVDWGFCVGLLDSITSTSTVSLSTSTTLVTEC
jgi:hypothetical protein